MLYQCKVQILTETRSRELRDTGDAVAAARLEVYLLY